MWLDKRRYLVHRGLPVDGQIALSQLLSRPRSDQVDPQNPPSSTGGVPLGHHLHQAICVAQDSGPPIAGEPVAANHHVVSGLYGRCLSQAGKRHLGVAINTPRHSCRVERSRRFAENVLHHKHALGEANVG